MIACRPSGRRAPSCTRRLRCDAPAPASPAGAAFTSVRAATAAWRRPASPEGLPAAAVSWPAPASGPPAVIVLAQDAPPCSARSPHCLGTAARRVHGRRSAGRSTRTPVLVPHEHTLPEFTARVRNGTCTYLAQPDHPRHQAAERRHRASAARGGPARRRPCPAAPARLARSNVTVESGPKPGVQHQRVLHPAHLPHKLGSPSASVRQLWLCTPRWTTY